MGWLLQDESYGMTLIKWLLGWLLWDDSYKMTLMGWQVFQKIQNKYSRPLSVLRNNSQKKIYCLSGLPLCGLSSWENWYWYWVIFEYTLSCFSTVWSGKLRQSRQFWKIIRNVSWINLAFYSHLQRAVAVSHYLKLENSTSKESRQIKGEDYEDGRIWIRNFQTIVKISDSVLGKEDLI